MERPFPFRVGEARGRRDEPDPAAHGLEHQDRVRGAAAAVLLFRVGHDLHPVPGHGTVAGRVVDQLELAVAHVVVDGLGDARARELEPHIAGERGHHVRRVYRKVPHARFLFDPGC